MRTLTLQLTPQSLAMRKLGAGAPPPEYVGNDLTLDLDLLSLDADTLTLE